MTNLNKSEDLNVSNNPLVSIWIYNYNYGKYLRECFDSVINQTYQNIEICFSDNASSDNSWKIAQEYKQKYPDIINIACNRSNFGADANLYNCSSASRGKYFVEMCSDDAMAPEFVEKCVKVLEEYPECGFAMVNRAIMDEKSNLSVEPPFYNESCIIKGEEQAAVYMMAAVNPSVSQIMYVTYKAYVYGSHASKELAGRWYGTRLMDFKLCCSYPIAYIKNDLLYHRIHGENDSLNAAGNLIEIIGPFILHYQFAEIARSYNLRKAEERLPAATEKLSLLCLRYCARFLIEGKDQIGEQYFHLSQALCPAVIKNSIYEDIFKYWSSNTDDKKKIIDTLSATVNFITRKISYNPPAGSLKISI